MVDKMMAMMMDRMMTKLSKEDIQAMMTEMMGQMFAGMTPTDKVAFMQTMMSVCIPKVTEGLDAAERQQLAETILGKMAAAVKQTVEVPDVQR